MNPEFRIQYKGTDICGDLQCSCGARSHVDGFFFYDVECEDCGAVWELSPSITVKRKVTP